MVISFFSEIGGNWGTDFKSVPDFRQFPIKSVNQYYIGLIEEKNALELENTYKSSDFDLEPT